MILDPQVLEFCRNSLRKKYPKGPHQRLKPIVEAQNLIADAAKALNDALTGSGSPARVEVERLGNYGVGAMKGLIIWTGQSTVVNRITLNTMLVRIDGKPIYLLTGEGAVAVFDAFLSEVEAAVADDSKPAVTTPIAAE